MQAMSEKIEFNFLDTFVISESRKSIKYKPHTLLLVWAFLICILPIFCWGQGLWIAVDKPRLFTSADIFTYLIALILLLYWIMYKLLSKHLYLTLSWGHVAITLAVITYFQLTHVWYLKMLEPDELKGYFLKHALINRARGISLVSFGGFTFLFGQLLLTANIIPKWRTPIAKFIKGTHAKLSST